MALGLLSGVSKALVSKVAIGAIVVTGVGGAVAKFVPPPSQDVAIWFDQPISKQHLAKGPNNLLLHVGRGQIATTVRVDVMTLNGGAGPTLTTDAIQTQKRDPYAKAPAEPENLQFAVVGWNAVPGTYKLIPSFTAGSGWTKGDTITVTVDGEPKPGDTGGSALPVPEDVILEPLDPDGVPTDGVPTDDPTVDPGDLDPGEPTPDPTNTLPPPPEPSVPPRADSTSVRTIGSHPTYEYWYRFTAFAIQPANATVQLNVKERDGDWYSVLPCGPLKPDDINPSKRQCYRDWQSSGANGLTFHVSYYFTVTANGDTYDTPVKTFWAGKGLA